MHSTAAAPPPGKHTSRPNSAAKSSLAGLQKTHTTSIRELYSEWCVSVRMHAQASALSAVPPALAQRASLSVKALTSSNSAATAFKGPKPVLKPVPGEDGLLEVSRESSNTFSDRLWLDQLRLTRCCVVKVPFPHTFVPPLLLTAASFDPQIEWNAYDDSASFPRRADHDFESLVSMQCRRFVPNLSCHMCHLEER